jgi:hypothetical protein
MKSLKFLGVLSLMVFAASVASAQATRTWVSGVGDDANPCSRTAPCKTFAGAISKTAAGGEIDCLDPAGFGAVTIGKSITIDCAHMAGGILNATTTGIIINALAASDVVQIRNLNIQGSGAGATSGVNGIRILGALRVHLQHVVIMGQQSGAGNGISVETSAATNITGDDITINKCNVGLNVGSTAGNAVVDFANSQFSGNNTGVQGRANSLITIKDSIVSVNNVGVSQSAGGSQINLVASQLSSNAVGVQSIGGSTVRIVGNTFAQNGTATNSNGGSILSDATNTNAGNGVVGAVGALPAPIKF